MYFYPLVEPWLTELESKKAWYSSPCHLTSYSIALLDIKSNTLVIDGAADIADMAYSLLRNT
jgi:hypothetical protein